MANKNQWIWNHPARRQHEEIGTATTTTAATAAATTLNRASNRIRIGFLLLLLLL